MKNSTLQLRFIFSILFLFFILNFGYSHLCNISRRKRICIFEKKNIYVCVCMLVGGPLSLARIVKESTESINDINIFF